MIRKNSCCRICKSEKLTKFLSLGKQPLANGFLRKSDLRKKETLYPLEVYFCHRCNLIQLVDVVSKEELFRDYVYFTSGMPRISDHFRKYAEYVISNFLKTDDFVLEIGSNDGVLLKFFKDRGFRILGVDPARNIAAVANANGVPTLCEFFNQSLARKIVGSHSKSKAILANNVVAHINDHHSLCLGIKELLADDGVFVFEAPYLIDMFENLTYDTIYHEHLSYLAIRPLIDLFTRFDLEIFDVHIVPAQGQSLRVFVGHQGQHSIKPVVKKLIRKELDFEMDKLTGYQELAKRIQNSKRKLLAPLRQLKKRNERIAAYGDGGIVATDSKKLAEKVRSLRMYGEKKRYWSLIPGINSRLDELRAAILLVKLKYLERWNEKRQRAASFYQKLLSSSKVILPQEQRFAKHVYHLFVIRAEKRNQLQEFLKKKGVVTGVHYPVPIHFQPACRNLGYQKGDFPESEKVSREILSLPLYPTIMQKQQEFVAKQIFTFYGRT